MRRTQAGVRFTFVLLAFEGPDGYARAGGLGTRVTSLSETLAALGVPVHFFFVGDPALPGEEARGRLHLHRWCQWISRYHPGGVYDGEEGKVSDYTRSLPPWLLAHVLRPALAAGRHPVVLAEEWQTAEALVALDALLRQAGLRHRAVLLWNANNTFGFHRIPWPRLAAAATLLTISRYMRLLLARLGHEALVVPNGIPTRLLRPPDPAAAARLRAAAGEGPLLVKVARWDPDKNWALAVDALALLKARLPGARLVARGGQEPYGAEVLAHARALGLRVAEAAPPPGDPDALAAAIAAHPDADLLVVATHLEEAALRPLYAAADAVLANSCHEPFGLVGLEAMAAGGVAVVGMTGEDYALDGWNAVVVQQSRALAVVERLLEVWAHPAQAARLRQRARQTARRFTWGRVVERLLEVVLAQARLQGLLHEERPATPSLEWLVPAYRRPLPVGR